MTKPLDPEAREVLLAMPGWRDDIVPFARAQAADLGMPVERWRAAVRRLIDLGLATYGPLASDQGAVRGSSYWLTERGCALRGSIEPDA